MAARDIRSSEPAQHNILLADRGRHAVLLWRLQTSYLICCSACVLTTVFLLAWNVAKGIRGNWNLLDWKHHRWEECLEVAVSSFLITETLLTIWLQGAAEYFSSCCCTFDFVVALTSLASAGYGLVHLARSGAVHEAYMPLLVVRFVLQPAQLCSLGRYAFRIREMQRVDMAPVDFGSLSAPGVPGDAAIELALR